MANGTSKYIDGVYILSMDMDNYPSQKFPLPHKNVLLKLPQEQALNSFPHL